MQLVIGLTGTQGSGKGTFMDIVKSHYSTSYFSLADAIREVASARGLLLTRDNLRVVANDLRERFGSDILSIMALNKVISFPKNEVFLIEPFRNPAEVTFLRDHLKGDFKFVVVSVDADPKIRYERINNRGRAGEHFPTLKEFMADQNAEMASKNPHAQRIKDCMAIADTKLDNNFETVEEFEKIVVKLVKDLLKE